MAAALGNRWLRDAGALTGTRAPHQHHAALTSAPPLPRRHRGQLTAHVTAALPASLPRPLPWEQEGAGGGSPAGSNGSSGSSSPSRGGSATRLKPLPRDVEGIADDVTLANPLQRMERLGTAWFGTIFELDGVCIEYECGDGGRSWQQLAQEEGKSPPPLWALKKARGMKNEQVWWPGGRWLGRDKREPAYR